VRVVGEAIEATHKRPRSAKELVGTDRATARVCDSSALLGMRLVEAGQKRAWTVGSKANSLVVTTI
jgi:hypothetical protein